MAYAIFSGFVFLEDMLYCKRKVANVKDFM